VAIEAVFLDIGETVVDETAIWGRWADWLGIPRLTFFAAFGATIAQGGKQSEVFQFFPSARKESLEGPDSGFGVEDLYPDARPCLEELRRRGYKVGLAGNQPARAAQTLQECELWFEWLVVSDLAGVAKPDPAFFEYLCNLSGLQPQQIAYVGDRVDNDVVPAAEAGMFSIHIRRGPWGVIQSKWPQLDRAHLRVTNLAELPDRLP
jgi:HAD superfamily hydrolase (TIGR01549 family)